MAGEQSPAIAGSEAPRLSPAAAAAERDWSELPRDALVAILGRLDAVEILMGPGLVCRSWMRAAAEEAALWRRVDMTAHGDLLDPEEAEAMARAAVDRSAGKMEAFAAESFGGDDLLLYIAERASSLKSLCLSLCDVSNEGFAEAVKKFPLLEELEISFCSIYGSVIECVGRACPRLKRFRLNKRWSHLQTDGFLGMPCNDSEALAIASTMHELQDLQLFGSNLTDKGLMAILDSCPHLMSLDIRQCFNIIDDVSMKAKCARIRHVRFPLDSVMDFEYRAYIGSDGVYFYAEAGYEPVDVNNLLGFVEDFHDVGFIDFDEDHVSGSDSDDIMSDGEEDDVESDVMSDGDDDNDDDG